MFARRMQLLRAASLLISALAVASQAESESTFAPDAITRDVIILGGGASGAYAAVRLREDFNQSIVVIEQKDRLGGHVDTFTDPVSGKAYEYGVQSYIDYKDTRAFFSRFNISTVAPTRLSLASRYVDFATGAVTAGYAPPNSTASRAALTKYLELCDQYDSILLPGHWNFPPADEIPADLLLHFDDFVRKYGIKAAIPQIFAVSNGIGDVRVESTLYAMRAFGAPLTRAFVGTGSPTFVPASRNNSELYAKIGALLGSDVLYSSAVQSGERSAQGVSLVVRRADGSSSVVRAKRLLVAVEPTLENLDVLGLSESERAVFSKWLYSTVYAAIVTHPSLPVNGSLVNVPAAAAPDDYLVLPETPYLGRFDYMGGAMWRVLLAGDDTFTPSEAKEAVQAAVDRMVEEGTLPAVEDGTKVAFVAFSNHGSMHLRVLPDELRKGFISDQYSLQGQLSTWYTGGGWTSAYTSIVWPFTDTVLPKLLQGV